MSAQLHIVVHDMTHPQGFDTKARKALTRLERICPRITSFHITLGESSHRHADARFYLKLDVRLPGLEIVVTRDHHEDIYLALREACAGARRQLLEHMERGRGADALRHAAIPPAGLDGATGNE